jgi:nucleoside-diphosphate-sugar epimerase
MTTIAVAGAAGFIGLHAVERLRADGHRVIAVDRPGADLDAAGAAGALLRRADLARGTEAVGALEGADVVVNATGLFDLGAAPATLEEVNADLARVIVRAARAAGARRLVHVSSVAVYGRPSLLPMPEEGAQRPRNAYERSKRDGEHAALDEHDRGIDVVVLRPTLVYGPRSRYGHALVIALAAQARALAVRRLPFLRGGPLCHSVHVEDVASAIEIAATHPDAPGRAFNVADDVPLPVGDSLSAIASLFGLAVGPARASVPAWAVLRRVLPVVPGRALARLNDELARGHRLLERQGRAPRIRPRIDAEWLRYASGEHVYDTSRLRSLGFAPRHPDFRAAIRGVVDWYRSAGFLPGDERAPEPRRPAPSVESAVP